jgi:hypothetical protein
MQAAIVMKGYRRGMSQGDIALALAKEAYKYGSSDDISAYILCLDAKWRARQLVISPTQVTSPGSNGAVQESILAPQTPQQTSLGGPIFRPPSCMTLESKPSVHLPGTHQHQRMAHCMQS